MSGARVKNLKQGLMEGGNRKSLWGNLVPLVTGNPMGRPCVYGVGAPVPMRLEGPNGFEGPNGLYLGPYDANLPLEGRVREGDLFNNLFLWGRRGFRG